MKNILHRWIPAFWLCITLQTAFAADDPAGKLEYFEQHVRPLLANHCYNCHSADNKAAGGLRLDDGRGVLSGGGRGPAVIPGDAAGSLLIQAVEHVDPRLQMPPDNRISDAEIEILKRWIADGAVWPEANRPEDLGLMDAEYATLRSGHWAWQALSSSGIPEVQKSSWPLDDMDRFVLARLEQSGLDPVPLASPAALLRRVTFALTGLPPTADEVREFTANPSDAAYEAAIERLLGSSAFGEHWGRHWLDVARYGESTGSARNLPYPHAWRYRDYVIDSFNRDKPWDRFVQEQIAGDLLPAATPEERRELLIATGFLALGVKDVNQRFRVRFEMDNIDEQIDTVSKAFLGLTVSCARCHDHKFDPIPARDYYALAGIFQSTELCAGLRNKMGGGGLEYYDSKKLVILSATGGLTAEQQQKIEELKQQVEEAKAEFERVRDSADAEKPGPNGRPLRQLARQKWNRLQAEYTALTDPAAAGQVALGVRDVSQPADTELRYRGEAEALGEKIPRGVLSVVQGPAVPVIPEHSSGRLELARWLSDPANPLASRVAVNRVWHHLFGAGIVRSVDNFGVTGDVPSHPELLDHLAQRFIRSGWSLKSLIRSIVLSRTYRLSSEIGAVQFAADPDNRLLWRHAPVRLSSEQLRDAQLAGCGTLNRIPVTGSPAQDLRVIELRNNGPEAAAILESARLSQHRSIYLPQLRTLTPPVLQAFDPVEQGMTTGAREFTTVPAQALYLFNNEFVQRQALHLAEELSQSESGDGDRVTQIWLRLLSRYPAAEELQGSLEFLHEHRSLAESHLSAEFAARSAAAEPAVLIDSSAAAVAAAQAQTSQLVNPDDVAQEEATREPAPVVAGNGEVAAWYGLVHAVLISAEFRYIP